MSKPLRAGLIGCGGIAGYIQDICVSGKSELWE